MKQLYTWLKKQLQLMWALKYKSLINDTATYESHASHSHGRKLPWLLCYEREQIVDHVSKELSAYLLSCKWTGWKGKTLIRSATLMACMFIKQSKWLASALNHKIKNLITPNRSCTKLYDEHAIAFGHSNLPADKLHLINTCVWCSTWSTASHHTSICCNNETISIRVSTKYLLTDNYHNVHICVHMLITWV